MNEKDIDRIAEIRKEQLKTNTKSILITLTPEMHHLLSLWKGKSTWNIALAVGCKVLREEELAKEQKN